MRAIIAGLVMAAVAVLPTRAVAQTPAEMTLAARETVMRQLEAFRAGDYLRAYTYASEAIRRRFDLGAFERMVEGGYPEIARSASAVVTGSQLHDDGRLSLRLTIRGVEGTAVDAVYQMVREGNDWRIDGVVTRPLAGDQARA